MSIPQAYIRSVLIQALTIVRDGRQFSAKSFTADRCARVSGVSFICIGALNSGLTRYQELHKSMHMQ